MPTEIINEIQKLNNILKQIKFPIVKKIIKYQDDIIQKNSLTNIKKYIIKVVDDRNVIKHIINKYERSITEIDKKLIISHKQNTHLKNIKSAYTHKLIQLTTANENIKQTLKKIILKIK